VTVETPILNLVPDVSGLITEGVLQLSVAVGGVQVAVAAVSGVVFAILAGQFAKTGFIVSIEQGFVTVTLKAHVDLLFFASVAV
jgi:hypothetical protein